MSRPQNGMRSYERTDTILKRPLVPVADYLMSFKQTVGFSIATQYIGMTFYVFLCPNIMIQSKRWYRARLRETFPRFGQVTKSA